jgi:hypothetical protein
LENQCNIRVSESAKRSEYESGIFYKIAVPFVNCKLLINGEDEGKKLMKKENTVTCVHGFLCKEE